MSKFLKGLFLFLSLFFLFGGLLLVGEFSNHNTTKAEIVGTSNYKDNESVLSMKQIDSVTARYNYNFTSSNAEGISVYSVRQ